jgi:hypothetical protein
MKLFNICETCSHASLVTWIKTLDAKHPLDTLMPTDHLNALLAVGSFNPMKDAQATPQMWQLSSNKILKSLLYCPSQALRDQDCDVATQVAQILDVEKRPLIQQLLGERDSLVAWIKTLDAKHPLDTLMPTDHLNALLAVGSFNPMKDAQATPQMWQLSSNKILKSLLY